MRVSNRLFKLGFGNVSIGTRSEVEQPGTAKNDATIVKDPWEE